MKNKIKLCVLASMAFGYAISSASAELLFSDNFNTGDGNLSNADIATRAGGTLAADSTVWLQSAKVVQKITGNQINMQTSGSAAKGRVRFGNSSTPFNWAAGATGTSILNDGGMRIEFDWTTPDDNTSNWIAFDFAHATGVEPNQRVTNAQTDYGILLRGNGGAQRFDNGVAANTTGSFTATTSQQHVILDFAFTSFADGSAVQANVTVGGTLVDSYAFTFDPGDTAGVLNMELETSMNGMLFDNYSVSTIPEPATMGLVVALGGALLWIRKRLLI